jgi:hypothetical protein
MVLPSTVLSTPTSAANFFGFPSQAALNAFLNSSGMNGMTPLQMMLAQSMFRNLLANAANGAGGYGGGGSYGGGGGGGSNGGGSYMPSYNASRTNSATDANGESQSNGNTGLGTNAGYTSQQLAANASDFAMKLVALGIPADGGHIQWPVGLRILRSDNDAKDLRQQIEASIHLLVYQAAGTGNARYVVGAVRALEQLRSATYLERYSLGLGNYQEAERFIDKLETVIERMR